MTDTGLVVDAIRSYADLRRRTAERAALAIDADERDGKDVRSSALRVNRILAEAAKLGVTADALISGQLVLTDKTATPVPDEAPTEKPRKRRKADPAAQATPEEMPTVKGADGPPPARVRRLPKNAVDFKGVLIPEEDPITGEADEDAPSAAELAETGEATAP